MAQTQNKTIISVSDFIGSRGMKHLIDSAAKTQTGTIGGTKVTAKDDPKAKRKNYVRINQPKKG